MTTAYEELQKRIVDRLRVNSGEPAKEVSTIPIQTDYTNDLAICLTSMVFVPADTAQEIQRLIITPLKDTEPQHYYYPPESMHLTIKNIRTVHEPPLFSQADVENVNHLFADEIPRHPSLTFSLEETVAFRTSVSLVGYCDEKLRDLVRSLDARLKAIGIPDNKRYVSDNVFFGNVTLCRYVHQPTERFLETVNRLAHVFAGELRVQAIHLITCNAVCSPASLTRLYSYILDRGAAQ